MRILLVCAAGMSTSLVMKKIVKAFGPEEQGWEIKAEPVDSLETVIDNYDVILLGPQIGYKKAQLAELASIKNKPLDVINPMDYGMGNGEKILAQIKTMINK
ncbi:PTS sugar transporter subunit IIB [Clostridium intestinale]|uniref:PTS sugar transporter subunit IIB n=1 Tax=Clostridium intestinale TaxID=36845 RepID=A0A7D6VRY4_9CLOT|nr:PTS sugar transporter subunit IIB [Clostridium intestinale]QLY80649.1 PTS sugar transporter subunit IIB [Clostridium intestinale]